MKRILRNLDWWLIFAVLVLMGCGLGLIDSATHSFAVSTGKSWHFNRQSTFMLIAIGFAIFTLRFDYRILKNYATPFYIFNVLLLVAVMLFGHTQLGAQRWIQIGGFTVQPSEFAKVFLIICLAAFMEKRIEWLEDFKDYIPVFLYIFVPFVLVLKQPDLGTSLTFIAILLGMIFVSGFKYRWFAYCSALFVALMPLIWQFVLKDYQKNRIRVFLNPELDPYGSGYHVIQSKIAIGSGGLFGKGWLEGTQSQLNFLPENHTDFIFAVVGEEFGFVGSTILILLYVSLVLRIITLAERQRDAFARVYGYCVASIFIFHIVINLGMVLGISPVIGIPLPFFSYGGSSLWSFTILLFILLRIDASRTERGY